MESIDQVINSLIQSGTMEMVLFRVVLGLIAAYLFIKVVNVFNNMERKGE